MQFSTEQLVTRWEQLRAIKNLMGRLSADYTLKKEGQMYEAYWSRREDVALGVNEGWYDGKAAVAGYYAALDRQIEAQSALIAGIFPKELGGKSRAELHGVGTMDYKPIDTPVIEIAADGQTAKGIWCIRGSHTKILTAGPVAYWEWGWFAADFILEGGGFRLWHLQYLQEVCRPNGSKWYGAEQKYPDVPAFSPARDFALAAPNRPAPLRPRYHERRPFTRTPRVPVPYQTFAETFSYGPEEVQP